MPVYPASLYEFFNCLMLGVIFHFIKNKIALGKGILFSIFLCVLGTERFFIECIKDNPQHLIFSYSFSQSQIISVMMIFIGSLFILNSTYLYKRQM